jgi:hypothetical protein
LLRRANSLSGITKKSRSDSYHSKSHTCQKDLTGALQEQVKAHTLCTFAINADKRISRQPSEQTSDRAWQGYGRNRRFVKV